VVRKVTSCNSFLKPQKQQIWSATSTEADIKSLMAEVLAAALDAQQVAEKSEKVQRGFLGWLTVKPTPPSDQIGSWY